MSLANQFLTAALLAGLLAACGSSDAESPAPPPPETAGTTNAAPGAEWSRKRYERTREMQRNGQLRCDTIAYACPDAPESGHFVFCYAGDDLVTTSHTGTRGDHASLSESYYYDGEDMYFAFLTESAWRFDDSAADATEPATLDEVHEEIRLYSNGDLVDRRFRDYTLSSRDNAPPASLPDQATGDGVRDAVGPDAVLQVRQDEAYPCR